LILQCNTDQAIDPIARLIDHKRRTGPPPRRRDNPRGTNSEKSILATERTLPSIVLPNCRGDPRFEERGCARLTGQIEQCAVKFAAIDPPTAAIGTKHGG